MGATSGTTGGVTGKTAPTADAIPAGPGSVGTTRLVETNGIRLSVTEAGDRDAATVLLAHGFPELGYSWRHQIPALIEAGFHVLAPDQRGYGRSSRPAEVSAYDVAELSADLVGLLDDVGARQAVWVGHDWGASVVYAAAQLHPDRVAAVVNLSVPPVPRARTAPTRAFRAKFGDQFFYMLYFQEPGVADAELDADPGRTMRAMLGGLRPPETAEAAARMTAPGPTGFLDRLAEPDRLPDWISTAEFAHYVDEFTRTGFTGGLNWYRNLDRNWEVMAEPVAATITLPTLFIGGSADPVLIFTRRDRAAELVSGAYREVLIDGAGHWLQQERPDEVNELLLEFLGGLSWDPR